MAGKPKVYGYTQDKKTMAHFTSYTANPPLQTVAYLYLKLLKFGDLYIDPASIPKGKLIKAEGRP